MIRFIRDPQPPHNSSYRNGMVRDLGPALNAQFIASGDAVDFVEEPRQFPPPNVLLPLGEAYSSPVAALTSTEVGQTRALVSEAWISDALQALIGVHPTRLYHDDEPLLIDAEPIFHTPD